MNIIKNFIIKFIRWYKFIFRNFDKSTPVYTKQNLKGLKIHLGSGDINIQGWLNIDSRNFSHIHLVSENFDLNKFSDNSVSAVYLSHVLEHFSFKDSELLLRRIWNKLETGGSILLSVPSFENLNLMYSKSKDLEKIKYALMGGQDYEYNFHKSVYDNNDLQRLLIKCGYKNFQKWNTKDEFGTSLEDWSDKSYEIHGEKIPVSLNLKAFKA